MIYLTLGRFYVPLPGVLKQLLWRRGRLDKKRFVNPCSYSLRYKSNRSVMGSEHFVTTV